MLISFVCAVKKINLRPYNKSYKQSYQAVSGIITWRSNNPDLYPSCPGKVTTIGHRRHITIKTQHSKECKPKITTKVKEVTAQLEDMAFKNPDI